MGIGEYRLCSYCVSSDWVAGAKGSDLGERPVLFGTKFGIPQGTGGIRKSPAAKVQCPRVVSTVEAMLREADSLL